MRKTGSLEVSQQTQKLHEDLNCELMYQDETETLQQAVIAVKREVEMRLAARCGQGGIRSISEAINQGRQLEAVKAAVLTPPRLTVGLMVGIPVGKLPPTARTEDRYTGRAETLNT
jgi:hypothetical protein